MAGIANRACDCAAELIEHATRSRRRILRSDRFTSVTVKRHALLTSRGAQPDQRTRNLGDEQGFADDMPGPILNFVEPTVGPTAPRSGLPLSAVQRLLRFSTRQYEASNVALSVRISGPIERQCPQLAIRDVIEHHGALHIQFLRSLICTHRFLPG